MKPIQLLMLPFGGGNEASYQKFESYLDSSIQMVSFEMPGKGRRIKEPLLKNIHLIVEENLHAFKPILKEPYAIYGHSMGAYVGHLLIHRLREENLPLPVHAFFTSKVAPSRNYNKKRSILTDDQFIEKLRILRGMPDAILDNPELLRIFLPMIRNDFDAIDLYKYQSKTPYPVNMTVICGTHEDVPDEELTDWQKETSGSFMFERWEGHHFWIFDHLPELCKLINNTLQRHTT